MTLLISLNYSDVFPCERELAEKIFKGSFLIPRFSFENDYFKYIRQVELVVPSIFSPDKVEKIKKFIDTHKLVVRSLHQPIAKNFFISLEEINQLIKTANFFSAKVVVVHLSAIGNRILNTHFLKQIKKWQDESRVQVALENSTKDLFTLFNPRVYRGEDFGETVTKAGLSIALDTSHLSQSGGDILKFYEKYQQDIKDIHLSDSRKTLFSLHLPLGRGKLPINEFLSRLVYTSYQGLLTLEISSDREGMLASINLVKSFF